MTGLLVERFPDTVSVSGEKKFFVLATTPRYEENPCNQAEMFLCLLVVETTFVAVVRLHCVFSQLLLFLALSLL